MGDIAQWPIKACPTLASRIDAPSGVQEQAVVAPVLIVYAQRLRNKHRDLLGVPESNANDSIGGHRGEVLHWSVITPKKKRMCSANP